MWSERVITLHSKEDFEKYASNYIYGLEHPYNSFIYDDIIQGVKVNKKDGMSAGGFRIPLFNMLKNDVVEIEAEYKLNSGDSAGFLVYGQYDGNVVDVLNPNVKLGEWTNIKTTIVLDRDFVDYIPTQRYIEIGGYGSAKFGEYELRNVVIRLKSKNAVPVILERGSTVNGEWVRYSDGTQKCWGKNIFENVSISSPSGSGFYSASNSTILGDYPKPFTEEPMVFINNLPMEGTTGSWTVIVEPPVKTKLPRINLFAYTERTVSKAVVNWFAIGKWK